MAVTQTRTPAAVRRLANWVGDAWETPDATGVLEVINPATGAILAEVPMSTGQAAGRAVRAAASAFPAWAATPLPARLEVLIRLRALLDRAAEELAALVTAENGKTLSEARGEVRRAIEVVDFSLGAPSLLMGRTFADVARGVDVEMHRVPLGVVVGITPFNFPAMVPMWMMPPAIVCGNTFVLKPSERVPLSAVRLAELWHEAGLPPGVLNLVHGDRVAVDALIGDGEVRAVSFVGSEPVARHVYATSAAAGKRVQALGGAKNFLVVMPDADLEAAVAAICASAFGNAGERCLATSVVVAVGDVADPLVQRLAERAAGIRLGDGSDADSQMGPVVSEAARRRIVAYIERGVAEGARLVRDGRGEGPTTGWFVGPTLFDDVRPEMAIARDEIFGPVLSIMRAPDLAGAIALANASAFGNAASIFTASGGAARQFRQGIRAGMVGVNIGVPAPVAYLPFAGWKRSFFGDLHATGEDALAFYTERQVVTSRWP
jgi:malonate-semialdehyde dehydrogenase (acetylating)/methylmalonate-semialdehyde dehydrogenase